MAWAGNKAILTALAGFALFLGSHVIIFRTLKPRRAPGVLGSALALGLLMDGLMNVWLREGLGSSVCSLVIYSLLVLHYIVWVFGMGETAIRVRLMCELSRRPSRQATLREIYEAYNAERILQVRLSRLVEAGQLHYDGRTYRIGKRYLFFHDRLLRIVKSLLGISQPVC